MLARSACFLINFRGQTSRFLVEAAGMALILQSLVRKPAMVRRWGVALIVVATLLVSFLPQSASAWPCRWRADFCGYDPACFRPFVCRPICGLGYAGGYGYSVGGYGFMSYRSYSSWTPGFYSGWSYPAFGCGWYPYNPVIYTPSFNCYPSAFAPVYGPAGVLPFMGIGAASSPATSVQAIAARPAAVRPRALVAVRSSNADARLRAGRLVAVGDRHLRDAIAAPAKLAKALDAYRRAATIAADQPDIYLRQAIVLTALNRGGDAASAVDRAAAIDARLGSDPQAALAAAERLPPVPALSRPAVGAITQVGPITQVGQTALAARSTSLLGRIFKDSPAGDDAEVNWIADRWSRQWADGVSAVAQK
jgi:hypothetical protein